MQLTDGILVYLALLLVGLTEISLTKSRVDIEKKPVLLKAQQKYGNKDLYRTNSA
jgi:hypothetical protein